jgi:predicted TIM-barrel fold metal-dependent hydrolase
MQAPKTSRGVDCHAHVFSREAPAIPGARYRPGYAATLTEWQSHWRDAGITHGVLVQPSFFGTDNREMQSALLRDQARLRGVAVISPGTRADEIARLHDSGVRAIRWNLYGRADFGPYNAPEWSGALARIGTLGWHLEVFVSPGRVPDILPALCACMLPVVFDHFGSPGRDAAADATFAAVETLARTRPVFCKLSAPYRMDGDCAALVQRWRGIVGARAFIWGSDWPWTGHEGGAQYAALRAELDRWIAPHEAAAVLWDNAAALYGFA